MSAQTVGALVIVAVAGAWLVRRFWRRGFDDEAHGCSSCHVEPANTKVTGLTPAVKPRGSSDRADSNADASAGPRTRGP